MMYGVISAGKEARVYWAKDRRGRDVAVKIYLTSTAEFRKTIKIYIEGDPRFERIRGGTRQLIYAGARKEFRNLKRMFKAGVRVPEPYFCYKNILVMEFIGEEGRRAHLLKEVDLDLEDYERIFNTVVEYMRRMYQGAGLVHADLSEYNIMIYGDEVVIIDVGQAVSLDHPMAEYFLWRDIRNVLRYFSEVGVDVPEEEELYRRLTREERGDT